MSTCDRSELFREIEDLAAGRDCDASRQIDTIMEETGREMLAMGMCKPSDEALAEFRTAAITTAIATNAAHIASHCAGCQEEGAPIPIVLGIWAAELLKAEQTRAAAEMFKRRLDARNN